MGCLKRIGALFLILVLVVVVFLNRDRITGAWNDLRGGKEETEVAPTQELADGAADKLTNLRDGEVTSVALSEIEVQSLLQFKFRQLLPAFVDSPRVELKDGKVTVSGRVPVDRLPQINELGEAAGFLPDTTEVGVTGQILPLSDGRVALAVDQVRAARIPLPRRLVPGALRKLGRKDEPGLPEDALAVRLPSGVDAAYVRGDSLVFLKNGRKQ
jgi:hypothetical protein